MIEVNLLWLRPGRVGGTETYSTQLLEAIASADRSIPPIRLVVTREVAQAHAGLIDRFEHRLVDGPGGRWGRVFRERRSFGGADVRAEHHLGGTVAGAKPTQRCVTIYDVQALDLPENFDPLKRRFLRHALPRAVSRSQIVCVMTRWVGDRLAERLGTDPEQCRVVPPAFGEPVEPRDVEQPPLDRPYLLFPAVTWPHKRHHMAIRLMERIADRELNLVLTGGEGPAHGDVMAAIDASSARDRVTHLGRVSAARLERLYRSAEALVMPSMYEGFGQPAIEAMQRGCPVISSGHAALPEVVGEGGMVVGDDIDEWVAAIERARGSERDQLIARGRARAAEFTPAAAAAAQLGVYDELIGIADAG